MEIRATLRQFIYSFIDVDDHVKVCSESNDLLFEGSCTNLRYCGDTILLESDVTSIYAYDTGIIAIWVD